MKKLVILPAFLILVLVSQAQTKISGTVRDMKSHIVAGASIQIKGSYDGAVSDSTSHFNFKSFEKGTQTIVVSNIGFKSVEQVIELKGEPIEINFALKEEVKFDQTNKGNLNTVYLDKDAKPTDKATQLVIAAVFSF